MLEFHGFQVAVVCDEQELETYSTSEEGRVMSGWIASEVGKPFAIRIRQVRPGKHPHTLQRVYMDGTLVSNLLPKNADTGVHRGSYPTPTTFAPFQFAAIQTTDDPALSAPSKADDNLGVIKVELERRIRLGTAPNMSATKDNRLVPAVVHERNKKRILGGLSISTGPVQEVSRIVTVDSKPYKASDPDPYVTFVFKYRSREYLLAEGIVPRPAPAPAKRQRDASPEQEEQEDVKPPKRVCVDVEEHDAARRRMRELKDELRNIEARLAEDLGQPPPDIKREPFPFAVGQVVDLTGPDSPAPKRRGTVKLEEPPAEIRVGRAAGTVIDLTDD